MAGPSRPNGRPQEGANPRMSHPEESGASPSDSREGEIAMLSTIALNVDTTRGLTARQI